MSNFLPLLFSYFLSNEDDFLPSSNFADFLDASEAPGLPALPALVGLPAPADYPRYSDLDDFPAPKDFPAPAGFPALADLPLCSGLVDLAAPFFAALFA